MFKKEKEGITKMKIKVRFHQSMDVAKKVLEAIGRVDGKDNVAELTVTAYSNCREQGYFVTNYNYDAFGVEKIPVVAFSENRNSDEIVVYFGRLHDRDFEINNIPSEDTYRNRRQMFAPEAYDEAAEFIVSWMQGQEVTA